MRRVEVTWVDSRTVFGTWTELDGLGVFDFDELRVTSVGYLYEQTAEALVLVQSHGQGQVLSGIAIPQGAVLIVKELL